MVLARGNIFMRGLSSGGSGNQSQSTTAPFPNVALYLDDQSMQFPARNNDVYMVDMERVEVLEGPQGTLFGGGAEAGAIRYITNKPKLDVTEGNVNAGYGMTAGGDPNNNLNATLNLPIRRHLGAARGDLQRSPRRLHSKRPRERSHCSERGHQAVLHPNPRQPGRQRRAGRATTPTPAAMRLSASVPSSMMTGMC